MRQRSQKLEKKPAEAEPVSDAPSSSANSLSSRSVMSGACPANSSCDDMGASDSDDAASEPKGPGKAAPRKHGKNSRPKLRSRSARHETAQYSPDDSEPEAGEPASKAKTAANGRTTLSGDAHNSDSDGGAGPADAQPQGPSMQPDTSKSAKKGKRHQITDQDNPEPNADAAASHSDGAGRVTTGRRSATHARGKALVDSDDDLVASPDQQAPRARSKLPEQPSGYAACPAEGAMPDEPPAEPMPVRDEAVDLFDSSSDGEGPAERASSSEDEASGDEAAGTTAGEAGDAEGADRREAAALSEPMDTEAAGGASPTALSKSVRSARGSRPVQPSASMKAENADNIRQASPASTECLFHGDDQAELHEHEMADAEEAGDAGVSEPAADIAVQLHSSDEGSPCLARAESEEEGLQPDDEIHDDRQHGHTPSPLNIASRKLELCSGRAEAGSSEARSAKGMAAAPEHPAPAALATSLSAQKPDAAVTAMEEDAAEGEDQCSPPPMLTSRKTSKKPALMRMTSGPGVSMSDMRTQPQQKPSEPDREGPTAADGAAQGKAGPGRITAAASAQECEGMSTAGAAEGQLPPRLASAEDDSIPLSALAKKGATPQTGGRAAATPQDAGKGSGARAGLHGVEKRHGLSSSKRKGQRSSTRLKGKVSKHYGEGTPKRSLILSNEEVSSGWKV